MMHFFFSDIQSAGTMHRRFSHIRVVLREIDFKLKIYQARSLNQKKKWVQRQLRAEEDAERVQKEREELEQLQQQAQEQEAERQAKK